MLKRKLSPTDLMILVINLIPLWGVWFKGWDPRQMFLIYCCESIIVGFFNILKMLITTQVKKKDVWDEKSGTEVSGYFFILFFIVHYGFFVSIQLMFFFGAIQIPDITNPLKAITALPGLLDDYTQSLLLLFICIYAVRMVIEFIFSGDYKTTSLGLLMFSPYLRIFIQQFVVIIGSLILTFGAGKLFMLLFVLVKIFFEVFINYDRALRLAIKKDQLERIINNRNKLS